MSEQHRHQCECAYWLKMTSGDKALVDDLIERVAIKRGHAAADRLRQGMREERQKQKGAAA